MNIELQTQQTFRTLMRAMGYPGTVQRLSSLRSRTTGAANLQLIADTLLDQDVTFCVIGAQDTCEIEDILRARTNSSIAELSLADLIIVPAGASKGKLPDVKKGVPEYPDRGATVLFCVESLADGSAEDFLIRLTGPGIPGEKYVQIRGLDHAELGHLQELNSGYPLGVDSIFVDQNDNIMCIPRSAKIQVR